MSRVAVAAVAAVALIGGAVLSRRVADSAAQAEAMGEGDGATALDYINPLGALERQVEQYQTEAAMQDTNTAAFLAMIASAEGTDRRPDPYRVCYAYAHTIADLSDHPAVTGEWKGERLPDAMCAGAGFGPGCVSSAAGRYQLIKSTWLLCKRQLGLTDFGPASQDAAAVYLIRKRGALGDVQAGRVADAVAKCRLEWASLPGAGYGQPERRLTALVDAYERAGGVLA